MPSKTNHWHVLIFLTVKVTNLDNFLYLHGSFLSLCYVVPRISIMISFLRFGKVIQMICCFLIWILIDGSCEYAFFFFFFK